MCPEAERSFDNTYSGKRGQPFDVPDSSKVTSPGRPLSPESVLKPSAPLPAHFKSEMSLPK